MKHNIKIKNISFSDDFNDVTGLLSYWVSGTLSFKDEEYEILESIDRWENIDDLHLLHETPFTEKNFKNTSSEESLLKFIIIELFISYLNDEKLKLKW